MNIFTRPTSGGGGWDSKTLEFGISGIEDAFIAEGYANSLISESLITPKGVLWLQGVDMQHQGHKLWYASAAYGPEKKVTGTVKFDFETSGGTVHVKTSKRTRGSYKAAGVAGAIPDHKGSIGVKKDAVDGTDLVIPALKLTYAFKHPAGMMNEAKARYLASVTGMVNSVPWRGFQACEALLLGATGSGGSDSEAEVKYTIAASANAQFSIGDIANIAKKGHDYIWYWFDDKEDGGHPVTRPTYAYVEQMYDEIDFRQALGF